MYFSVNCEYVELRVCDTLLCTMFKDIGKLLGGILILCLFDPRLICHNNTNPKNYNNTITMSPASSIKGSNANMNIVQSQAAMLGTEVIF